MYAHILQARKHTWPLTAGLLQGWAGKKPPELPPAGGNETEQSPSCPSSLDSVICSQILILALPPHSPLTNNSPQPTAPGPRLVTLPSPPAH